MGVYLAAASCLLVSLAPVVGDVAQQSRKTAATATVEGASRVLDGLEPGTSVRFVLPGGGEGTLVLNDHTLTLSSAGETYAASCRWSLPHITLRLGVEYSFSLGGSTVKVSPGG